MVLKNMVKFFYVFFISILSYFYYVLRKRRGRERERVRGESEFTRGRLDAYESSNVFTRKEYKRVT